FTEAKTDDGKYDFQKISAETKKAVLGDDLKTTIDIAKRIQEKNAELDEVASEVEALEAAEKAAGAHAAREKVRGHVPMPEGKGDRQQPHVKSLGELLAEEKAYEDWVKRGTPGGI